jgi:hypothetical protein
MSLAFEGPGAEAASAMGSRTSSFSSVTEESPSKNADRSANERFWADILLRPLSPDPAVVAALDKALGSMGEVTRLIAEKALQILATRHFLVTFADLALLSSPSMAEAKADLDSFLSMAPLGARHKAQAFFQQQAKAATSTSNAGGAATPTDSPAAKATISRDTVAQRLLDAFRHARSADYKPAISMFFASETLARFLEQVKVEIAESEVILFCPSCTNKRYKFIVQSSGSLSVNQLLRHLRKNHNCADAGAKDKTQNDDDSDSEKEKEASSKRKNMDMPDTPSGAAKKKHGPIDAFIKAKPPAAASADTAAAPPPAAAAATATATATASTPPAGAVLALRCFQRC